MADRTQIALDANTTTQTHSTISTINQYDFALRNSELGLITSSGLSSLSWDEHNRSVQLCMKKLNVLNSTGKIAQSNIDNCFAKMSRTLDLMKI